MATGFLVIISGPSGSGKSTICRKLRRRDRSLAYSVSCTTRSRRPSERDGVHYRFLTPAEFRRRRARGGFLEWAKVYSDFYGTPKEPIDRAVRGGAAVLLDIDVQGAVKVMRRRRKDAVSVFLLAPSVRELRRRLRRRGDTDDTLETRMRTALREFRCAKEYDYWVVNDSLDAAVRSIETIIRAERSRPGRLALTGTRLGGFIRA